MNTSIFFEAAKQKLRFESVRGELTVEQLFDLPLQSKNQFDLDTIAKTVNGVLKSITEESFVDVGTNPAKQKFELMLEIVKTVIAIKKQENQDARDKANKSAEREKLISILSRKQDQELEALSADEIADRIRALA
jgi:hypothetical protein